LVKNNGYCDKRYDNKCSRTAAQVLLTGDHQTVRALLLGLIYQVNVNREDNRLYGEIIFGTESSLDKTGTGGYNHNSNDLNMNSAVGKSGPLVLTD